MSDTICHKINCGGNAATSDYYKSVTASDSGGAGAVIETDAGQSNPNCGEGYVWGGENCVLFQADDTECSDGYHWGGLECIEDGDSCSDGYYVDSNGDCIDCPNLITPDVGAAVGFVMVIYNNPINEVVTVKVNVTVNGVFSGEISNAVPGSGNTLLPIPNTAYNLGDEICIYYSITPLAGSLYETCNTKYSNTACIILHTL
jgi:hypothetical protein